MEQVSNFSMTTNKTNLNKIDKYIEVVVSSIPRLNAMSRDTQAAIIEVLEQEYLYVKLSIVDNLDDLNYLVAKKPDLVVLGMKLILLDPSLGYDNSPKMWLSTYLKDHSINFTGSNTSALSDAYNKQDAKDKVMKQGLKSPNYFISTVISPLFRHKLTYPLFIKPTNGGDSKGINEDSVVYNYEQLENKIEEVHSKYQSDALIEEYLPGREFSVGVMRLSKTNDYLAMPIEIKPPLDSNGNAFLSKKVKDSDTEKTLKVHNATLIDLLSQLAINVFKTLEARDYGRIDMRLDQDGIPNFIEANLMPGLSSHGYLSRCLSLNGLGDYRAMILDIVNLAFERSPITQTEDHSQSLIDLQDQASSHYVSI